MVYYNSTYNQKGPTQGMGMSEVVMLDMKGHMVVLGTALGTLMVPGYWS